MFGLQKSSLSKDIFIVTRQPKDSFRKDDLVLRLLGDPGWFWGRPFLEDGRWALSLLPFWANAPGYRARQWQSTFGCIDADWALGFSNLDGKVLTSQLPCLIFSNISKGFRNDICQRVLSNILGKRSTWQLVSRGNLGSIYWALQRLEHP